MQAISIKGDKITTECHDYRLMPFTVFKSLLEQLY